MKLLYIQPLPIDTINKFWGIDSRILKHDDTVQKQSFDQAYKNFWSFVDFNVDDNLERLQEGSNVTNVYGSSLSNSVRANNNLSNSGNNFSQSYNNGGNDSKNNSGFSYLEARKRADELLRAERK